MLNVLPTIFFLIAESSLCKVRYLEGYCSANGDCNSGIRRYLTRSSVGTEFDVDIYILTRAEYLDKV